MISESMPDIQYSIDPVEKKPKKNTRKGSNKYAPIIEACLESEHDLVRVDNTGKEAYYLSMQLRKTCEKMGLDTVYVSVRNKEVYLERQSS